MNKIKVLKSLIPFFLIIVSSGCIPSTTTYEPISTVTPTTSSVSASPSGGKILYLEDGQIWQIDVPTNQIKQLTFDEGKHSEISSPKWSPNGQVFAYERYGKVWLGNRDGNAHRELVSANGFWWINSEVLRYCYFKDEGGSSCFLFKIESNTTESLQEGEYWWIGAYSPDISKVFLQEYQIVREKIQPQTTQFILDVNTRQKIFEHKTGEGFWTEDPQWTQNSKKVTFTASLSDRTLQGEVFIVDANGENLRQLTNFSDEERALPALLQWSPNEEWLALILATIESNELAILKSDGSILKRLGVEWVTLGGPNLAPVWSPDSQQIAFLSDQISKDNKGWQIYTVDIETGNVSQLTKTDGRKSWLDWK